MSQSWNVHDGLIKGGWHFRQHKLWEPHASAYSTILSPVEEAESGKGRYRKERGNGRKNRAWIGANSPDTEKNQNISKAEKGGSHIEICPVLSCLLNRSAAGFPHFSFSSWWQHERTRLFQHVALPHYWAWPAACSSLLGRMRRWRQGLGVQGILPGRWGEASKTVSI